MKLGVGNVKKFPDFIHNLNTEQAGYMLSGYIFGDGHFSKTGQVSNTISVNISDGLDILCRKLCIIKNTRKYIHPDSGNDMWSSSFTKSDTQLLIDFINKREDLAHVFDNKLFNKMSVINIRHYDARFKSIKTSVVEGYKGRVYNLEVHDDNSYVVNGAAVHNCDALSYLCRNVNFNRNAAPTEGYKPNYHYNVKLEDKDLNPFEKHLKQTFTLKLGRRR
jgi:hypothetical protein